MEVEKRMYESCLLRIGRVCPFAVRSVVQSVTLLFELIEYEQKWWKLTEKQSVWILFLLAPLWWRFTHRAFALLENIPYVSLKRKQNPVESLIQSNPIRFIHPCCTFSSVLHFSALLVFLPFISLSSCFPLVIDFLIYRFTSHFLFPGSPPEPPGKNRWDFS